MLVNVERVLEPATGRRTLTQQNWPGSGVDLVEDVSAGTGHHHPLGGGRVRNEIAIKER